MAVSLTENNCFFGYRSMPQTNNVYAELYFCGINSKEPRDKI
jgi:hypothetical protein